MEYLIGAGLAGAECTFVTFVGIDRDRAQVPVITTYYILFAIIGNSRPALAVECCIDRLNWRYLSDRDRRGKPPVLRLSPRTVLSIRLLLLVFPRTVTPNGIVWVVENTSPAVLHAYDATNLTNELYNSNQAANGRDQFSNNKFITPVVANGRVCVEARTVPFALCVERQRTDTAPAWWPFFLPLLVRPVAAKAGVKIDGLVPQPRYSSN